MKRLRIIAGPNGSGKTSVYEDLLRLGVAHFGVFVNADIIEALLKTRGILSFQEFGVNIQEKPFKERYAAFPKMDESVVKLDDFSVTDNFLAISKKERVDSYFACFIAFFIREAMLNAGIERITIETVMSHPGKLDLFKKAKSLGYRVYLYYVTTSDPIVNIGRVAARRATGGHDVPEEKIVKRYSRSLDNLYDAMILSDRAFLFDNSGKVHKFIAEYESKKEELRVFGESAPYWLQKYVIDKIH